MTTSANSNSIQETALHNFEATARRLDLEESVCTKFRHAAERIEWTGNPTLPSGGVRHIKAFLVRHSDALGPAKGGIRMTPSVTMDDISGLAMEMTWKTSLIGVPFGGGKAGICCDSQLLSARDKEAIVRSFTRGMRRHIGPEIYIPAPDMGTNETDMGHIRDCIAYSDGTSITRGCFVTGKPVVSGGIVGRRDATGKGVVYTILAACDRLGLDITQMRVAVQGFGNVGSAVAREIARRGARVVAVADISGAVMNGDGIDVAQLHEHVSQTGQVKGFEGADATDSDRVLGTDCDILVPAAAEGQVTAANAHEVAAKIIAEGANGPTTPAADRVLDERGISVIPDILCNAGGVFVSYLEYTQETQREQMTLPEVENRLEQRMKQRFADVYDYGKDRGLTMRAAAMDLAVGRVVEAIDARGFLP